MLAIEPAILAVWKDELSVQVRRALLDPGWRDAGGGVSVLRRSNTRPDVVRGSMRFGMPFAEAIDPGLTVEGRRELLYERGPHSVKRALVDLGPVAKRRELVEHEVRVQGVGRAVMMSCSRPFRSVPVTPGAERAWVALRWREVVREADDSVRIQTMWSVDPGGWVVKGAIRMWLARAMRAEHRRLRAVLESAATEALALA